MKDFADASAPESAQDTTPDKTAAMKADVADVITPDNGKVNLADIAEHLVEAMKTKGWRGQESKRAQIKALKKLAKAEDATLFEQSLAKLAAAVLREEDNLQDTTMTRRKRKSLNRILEQEVSPEGLTFKDLLENVDEYGFAAIAVTRVVIGLAFTNPAIGAGVIGAMTLASVGIGLRDVPTQFAKALRADWKDMPTEFSKVASMTKKGIQNHLWNLIPSIGLANFGKLFVIRGIEALLGHASDEKKMENLTDLRGTMDNVQKGLYELSQKDLNEIGTHVRNGTVEVLQNEAGMLTKLLWGAVGSTGYTVLDIALTQLTARGYIGRGLARLARWNHGEKTKFSTKGTAPA